MLFLSCIISKILYIFLNDILPIKGDFNTKYQKAYGKNPSHTKNEDKKKTQIRFGVNQNSKFKLEKYCAHFNALTLVLSYKI